MANTVTCTHAAVVRRQRRTFAAILTVWECAGCGEEFVPKKPPPPVKRDAYHGYGGIKSRGRRWQLTP